MNDAAMRIPRARLLDELEQRRAAKTARQQRRDQEHGPGRIPLGSYMENIGWPELFGFRMPDYLAQPAFAVEQYLRQQIWWADNVEDDTIPTRHIPADVGMYWDITLFGMRVVHTDVGVPEFQPHPFQATPDPALLGHFDFGTTGEMPLLIAKYEALRELNVREYGGRLQISFPSFHRGPLDIYVQLRGYEGFVADVAERPDQLRQTLLHLVAERLRFARERQCFLGEPALPPTTFVADDWVNIPFISPAIFTEFVRPAYRQIRVGEGPVTGFHTCGNMEVLVPDLLATFPDMDWLDVSGWNSVPRLDAAVDPRIRFQVSIINTVTLSGTEAEQRALLRGIAAAARRRSVSVCAQAIVRLYPTYDEVLARLNRFLALAREEFGDVVRET